MNFDQISFVMTFSHFFESIMRNQLLIVPKYRGGCWKVFLFTFCFFKLTEYYFFKAGLIIILVLSFCIILHTFSWTGDWILPIMIVFDDICPQMWCCDVCLTRMSMTIKWREGPFLLSVASVWKIPEWFLLLPASGQSLGLLDDVMCPVLQGMVLPAVPWGPEPHVLPFRVRGQEQLLPTDQSGLFHQPRPPHLLPLHRTLHRHGEPADRGVFIWLCDRCFVVLARLKVSDNETAVKVHVHHRGPSFWSVWFTQASQETQTIIDA